MPELSPTPNCLSEMRLLSLNREGIELRVESSPLRLIPLAGWGSRSGLAGTRSGIPTHVAAKQQRQCKGGAGVVTARLVEGHLGCLCSGNAGQAPVAGQAGGDVTRGDEQWGVKVCVPAVSPIQKGKTPK